MSVSISPRVHAIAYRIWGYAHPLEWDVSASDIAEALDERPQRIGGICRIMGWSWRLRANHSAAQRQSFVSNAMRDASVQSWESRA